MKMSNSVGGNAIKLVGESVAPGTSLLLDGRVLAGGAHLLAGLWAKAALGPVGLALVCINSYTTATTGKSLLKLASKSDSESASTTEAESADTTESADTAESASS